MVFEKFSWNLIERTNEILEISHCPLKFYVLYKMKCEILSLLFPVDIMTRFVKTFSMNLRIRSITWSNPVAFQFVALPYNVSCELLNTRNLELDTNYFM